ncbi:hypothetical protein DFH06DRAFT_1338192 [Mycena polygramma]|nr:hypothetical protein DFH06DRAFT_1338192 [Mycena polygramma]
MPDGMEAERATSVRKAAAAGGRSELGGEWVEGRSKGEGEGQGGRGQARPLSSTQLGFLSVKQRSQTREEPSTFSSETSQFVFSPHASQNSTTSPRRACPAVLYLKPRVARAHTIDASIVEALTCPSTQAATTVWPLSAMTDPVVLVLSWDLRTPIFRTTPVRPVLPATTRMLGHEDAFFASGVEQVVRARPHCGPRVPCPLPLPLPLAPCLRDHHRLIEGAVPNQARDGAVLLSIARTRRDHDRACRSTTCGGSWPAATGTTIPGPADHDRGSLVTIERHLKVGSMHGLPNPAQRAPPHSRSLPSAHNYTLLHQTSQPIPAVHPRPKIRPQACIEHPLEPPAQVRRPTIFAESSPLQA